MSERQPPAVGWIGTGRMGYAIVERLLRDGTDVWVWNRTRSRAEPLEELGAKIVDSPSGLAGRDVVFTMVAGSADLLEVTTGPSGVLSVDGTVPPILVDSSTVSVEASRDLRETASPLGVSVIAAPVSGNPKVVRSGRLTVVASGSRSAFDTVRPLLESFGHGVTWVGEEDEARLVKICHNLMLGAVSQCLAEITVLAEAGGVKRADLLAFLNDSVMGSTFTRYKTPGLVNLDFTPTFTWHLLRKDFELGLDQARSRNVPLPMAALIHQLVVAGIGQGRGDLDFAALIEMEAEAAGLRLEPENVAVTDGLS